MLHPINPPSCVNELLEIVALQQKMLEFANANSSYTDMAFRSVVPSEFVDWLINLKSGSGKGATIANRFIQELTSYIKIPPAEKEQILMEFIRDQEYYAHLNDSTFSFSLLPSKSDAHEKAKKCLCEFYELLGEGYPATLVGQPAGSNPFTKAKVVDGYILTNPDIEYVCPCCDNAFTDEKRTINEQGFTLEHYFPKALYPSICMHPLNLIPMCLSCNSRKGDTDPLNPSTIPLIQVSYQEAFHPVARPVIQHADLSFQARATVPDAMNFISAAPPAYEKSIAAYKILYQIPNRWETNWRRVDRQINCYLRNAIRRLGSQHLDDVLFDSAIQEAITDMSNELGQQPMCYPALKWLSWARSNKFQDLKQSFVL